MPDQELFRAVFLRHGHTDYTDKPPDINMIGHIAIASVSTPIRVFAAGKTIHLRTSPKVRAKGSGDHLSRFLTVASQKEESDLASVGIVKPEVARRLFTSYASPDDCHAVDQAYWAFDEFDDLAVFEPREKIRIRIFRYLSYLINHHLNAAADQPCYVCISHVEVLCHLISRPFGYDFSTDTPVRCAEPIFVVAVLKTSSQVCLSYVFRQRQCAVDYNLADPTNPY